MKLYNTLTHRKEELQPLKKGGLWPFGASRKKGRLTMFVCGPTVYDLVHIGNARTFIVFDVFSKYLRFRGFKLFYLQNITNIDDKIIHRAREENAKPQNVADRFEKAYYEDMQSLHIDSVDKYARATDHINTILNQVHALIEKGYAYAVPSVHIDDENAVNNKDNKDVYFYVSKFEDYGKLSRQNLDELEAGARVKTEANKKNHKDFVLWKARNYSYEPAWKSPWGMGRPGWHIEDTAMSEKYLGQQYDIHCGGSDLLFPHHESEIAQQEAASGKKPFVRYWMHSGHLTVNGEKMSKSLGNFVTLRDALKQYSPEALRFFSIATHYRSPVDYSERALTQAEAAVRRMQEFTLRLKQIERKAGGHDEALASKLNDTKNRFREHMDDDMASPEAFAALFEFIRETNPYIDQNDIGKKIAREILSYYEELNEVLGIIPKKELNIPKEIKKLSNTREELRREKKFEKADELRAQMEERGYRIDDTSYGPVIKKL